MKRVLSIILACALLISLVPAVFAAEEASASVVSTARTHEYVIGLSAFNTADLTSASAANSSAPVLQNGTALWHQASMAWDAVVDGANTESGNAIDPFMNFNATDKWAFAGTNMTRLGNGGVKLTNDYLQTQVGNGTFSGSYVYTAFKVYVDAPGTYTLQASSIDIAGDSGVMKPKVYFFKEGEATVSTPNRYPSDALVDYFMTNDDGAYETIGEVTVDAAGTYIVSFVGATASDTTTYPTSGSGKYYNLAIGGIKLLADEVSSVSVSAENTALAKGKTEALSLTATYTLSGVKTLDASEVSFSVAPAGIVSVSDEGVVTALSAGTATITATYGGKSAEIEFTVIAEPRTHEYIIGLSAFNTSDLKTVSGFYDGGLYNKASMAWDAVIDGAYTTSGNPIDPFMNLTKTDKWAFAGTNFSRATPVLKTNYLQTNVGNGTFSGSAVYVAYKIYVEEPGTYTLRASSMEVAGDSGTMKPKVFFFKEGETAIDAPARYPASTAVDYFDTSDNGEYETIGEVTVDEAGEYIVSFAGLVGDTTTYPVTGSGKHYYLAISGIKLALDAEEPEVPTEPNAEITGNTVTIGLTAIVNGVASTEAKALLSESSVVAGNINSVAVGSTVTLKAEDTETLKFLYWYNGNSGRIISDEAEYSFTAGTNTPIFAKYADVNSELTEYFSAAGQLVEESEGTFGAEADVARGNYYKLYKDTASAVLYDAVTKISNSANFVCWTKDGETVSYNASYTYFPWTGDEEVLEVTDGEKSSVPSVVLFSTGNNYMLEIVNFEGVEIIEKGILFGGNLTISSCAEKAVSVENAKQFTASSDENTARAYVIYRDGAAIRVAYSK